MKKFITFIVVAFILFLIYIIDYIYNGAPHTYRKEINGTIYDIETCLPVKNVEITFIRDTLTASGSCGGDNLNEGKSYYSDKNGIFKIPEIKGRYQRNSPFLMELSKIVAVSCENYITDTLNLREWKRLDGKPIFDTIWIKPIHNQFHEIDIR